MSPRPHRHRLRHRRLPRHAGSVARTGRVVAAAAAADAGSSSCSCSSCSLAAAGLFAAVRLSAPDPAPTVTSVLDRTVDVQSGSVSLPWPTTGQAAVAIPSVGVDMASAPEKAAARRQPDQAHDGVRDPARPPAEVGPARSLHHRHPGRRERLRRGHRLGQLQRAGRRRGADPRDPGARWSPHPLRRQLRRPVGPVGRRE